MKVIFLISVFILSSSVFAQLQNPTDPRRTEIEAKVQESRKKAAEERAKALTLRQEVEAKRKEIEETASKTE